jgi:hypothetical protein
MSRSRETDGSPASILAILDWLDCSRLASSACVRFRRRLHSRSPTASRTLSSMYAASSAVSRRNSCAVPTFQPFASRRRRFSSRTVVLPQSASARVNDDFRRRASRLAEHRQNHNGVSIGSVHNPPVNFDISDPEFVAVRPHHRHRPRMRHRQHLALLEQPQQIAGLDPRHLGERRRLDLSVKPDDRLVCPAYDADRMSDPTCRQDIPHNFAVERTRFARYSPRR